MAVKIGEENFDLLSFGKRAVEIVQSSSDVISRLTNLNVWIEMVKPFFEMKYQVRIWNSLKNVLNGDSVPSAFAPVDLDKTIASQLTAAYIYLSTPIDNEPSIQNAVTTSQQLQETVYRLYRDIGPKKTSEPISFSKKTRNPENGVEFINKLLNCLGFMREDYEKLERDGNNSLTLANSARANVETSHKNLFTVIKQILASKEVSISETKRESFKKQLRIVAINYTSSLTEFIAKLIAAKVEMEKYQEKRKEWAAFLMGYRPSMYANQLLDAETSSKRCSLFCM